MLAACKVVDQPRHAAMRHCITMQIHRFWLTIGDKTPPIDLGHPLAIYYQPHALLTVATRAFLCRNIVHNMAITISSFGPPEFLCIQTLTSIIVRERARQYADW